MSESRYLLDTSTISQIARGRKKPSVRLAQVSRSACATSVITLMEVEYGLARNPDANARRGPMIRRLLDDLVAVQFQEHTAHTAARILAALAEQGRPIGHYDVLIAATAISDHRILVTGNVEEFRRVDGLRVEDWDPPDEPPSES